MIVLGLAGPAGVGKSTVAAALAGGDIPIAVGLTPSTVQTGVSPRGVVIGLATPLRMMLAALGVPEEDTRGPAKHAPHPALDGRTPRHAMQTLGTEWGRNMISPLLWLRAWSYHAQRMTAALGVDLVVIDDVRFQNEVDYLALVHGAVVVELSRPGVAWSGEHASECGPSAPHCRITMGDGAAPKESARQVLEAAIVADYARHQTAARRLDTSLSRIAASE